MKTAALYDRHLMPALQFRADVETSSQHEWKTKPSGAFRDAGDAGGHGCSDRLKQSSEWAVLETRFGYETKSTTTNPLV